MKKNTIAILGLLVVVFSNQSFSQNVVYTTISKNLNKVAKSLDHNLNTAGDTLHLRSVFQLDAVEIIGKEGVDKYRFKDSISEVKIPLNDLEVGNYAVSVLHNEGRDDTYIYKKTIVFKIFRRLPISHDLAQVGTNVSRNTNLNTIPVFDLSENKIIKNETPSLKPNVLVVNKPQIVDISENKIIKNETPPLKPNVLVVNKPQVVDISENKIIKNEDPPLKPNVLVANRSQVVNDIEVTIPAKLTVPQINTNVIELPAKKKANTNASKLNEKQKKTYKSYNLTNYRNRGYAIESRAEYRKNNLRPNGRKYD